MPKGGRKYKLLLYPHIINRWWPLTFSLAVFIALLVGLFWGAEYYLPPEQNPIPNLSTWGGSVMLGVSAFSLFFTIFLLIIRNRAHVRCYDQYLRLSTPFFRFNISYKRIHRTQSAEVASLYPPTKIKGIGREVIEPIAGHTANILHLTSYPLPRAALKLFLSPFFFYDSTPHLVLILDDWMRFSQELDDRRNKSKNPRAATPTTKPPAPKRSGLLDDLTRK